MARHFFCAYCGTPLIVTRKALKNKQTIVDLVKLHECDEDNVGNITDADKPVETFEDVHKRAAEKSFPAPNETSDRRSKEHLRKGDKSTAPKTLLDKVKTGG